VTLAVCTPQQLSQTGDERAEARKLSTGCARRPANRDRDQKGRPKQSMWHRASCLSEPAASVLQRAMVVWVSSSVSRGTQLDTRAFCQIDPLHAVGAAALPARERE
jgi:hypothetical protein